MWTRRLSTRRHSVVLRRNVCHDTSICLSINSQVALSTQPLSVNVKNVGCCSRSLLTRWSLIVTVGLPRVGTTKNEQHISPVARTKGTYVAPYAAGSSITPGFLLSAASAVFCFLCPPCIVIRVSSAFINPCCVTLFSIVQSSNQSIKRSTSHSTVLPIRFPTNPFATRMLISS